MGKSKSVWQKSAVPHAHPHLHAIDDALLGYDALALVALALAAVGGICIVLARRKK